jgi:DNA polymerase V
MATALDLAQADPKIIRRQFSIVLERTLRELNGESCIDLEELPATKQQIVCSRSFGQKVTTLESMRQAITGHVSRAGEKLRKEGQVAGHLSVFIRTSHFKADSPQYSNSASYRFETPTADTSRLVKAAQGLLSGLWRSGFEYAKAGVMIGDFSASGSSQLDMFDEGDTGRSEKLMSVLDSLNQKQKGSVFLAGQGIPNRRSWGMKQDNLSPAYTTRWSDLPRVR